MKKKLIIAFIVIVLIAVAAFVVMGRVRGKSEEKPDRIEIVRRGPFVVKLSERGNLEPLIKVEVRSNVEGEIKKLYVDDGYDVVKGQELLQIDEKQIREEYNQALANYKAAQAEWDRAVENITLNSDRLESNIQLGEATMRSSKTDLEVTKARGDQQRSQARISIASMENLLEQDGISSKKYELALEQARTNEKSAKASFDNAKAELDRKKELEEKKFVTRQEVENAQLAYASALSRHESALQEIEAQKKNLETQKKIIENREMRLEAEKKDLAILEESIAREVSQVEIQIGQAKERLALLKKSESGEKQIAELTKTTANASLLRAESVLKRAEERLGWTKVIAPMSGRIVGCGVEEGEIITSGRSAWSQGPPIMIIADLSQMIVKSYIHEFDISKVEVGQKAEIKIEAYKDEVFEGEVKEISPSGQFMDGIIKFEVMVMVTKAPKPLMPGMTADIDIIVDERDNVLQLPIEAVTPKETIKVKTDIAKNTLSKIRDQKVNITINNYPDKKFAGKVAEIAPARPGFSTSQVTIIMEGKPKELQPGTSRTANLIMSDDEKLTNIEARIESEREYFVKLVKADPVESQENDEKKKKNGKKERNEEERMIEIGERTQNNVEVLDGLKEGDKVRVVPVGEEEENKEKKG